MNTRHRNPPPPHGDHRRYRYWKCRCDACREANRLYEKRRREGRRASEFVDPTGTCRRIRALIADGHTYVDLAGHLRCRPEWVAHLAYGRFGPRGVLRRTAQQVDNLYRRLVDEDPPTGRRATYARTVARRHGWHPPEAWDDATIDDPAAWPYQWCADLVDEVKVQRALVGRVGWADLTTAERLAVFRARGARSQNEVMRALRISKETASRWANRAAAAGRRPQAVGIHSGREAA